MSKNPSIARKKIFTIELIVVCLGVVLTVGVAAIKVMDLVKQPTLPPSVDLQQLELQKAITVIEGPTAN